MIIAPSLLAADFSRLEDAVQMIEPHVEWLHLDVMDGHFVPNVSFDMLCFHIESEDDPAEVIERIHSHGIKAGLAVSPDTDIQTLAPYLADVEMVLVMSVYPGFGGQKFLPQTCSRIREVKGLSMRLPVEKRDLYIQVDGGIDEHTAHLVKESGANVLVSGSFVFGNANPAQAIYTLRYA